MTSEKVFEAARDESYLEDSQEKWEDEHQEVYIGADVDAIWEKIKRNKLRLCSTDTAFTQHRHDKYYLETKDQKTADENIFERHVKLQADSGRIRGTRDGITISIG